jgi:hypothetical protein
LDLEEENDSQDFLSYAIKRKKHLQTRKRAKLVSKLNDPFYLNEKNLQAALNEKNQRKLIHKTFKIKRLEENLNEHLVRKRMYYSESTGRLVKKTKNNFFLKEAENIPYIRTKVAKPLKRKREASKPIRRKLK